MWLSVAEVVFFNNSAFVQHHHSGVSADNGLECHGVGLAEVVGREFVGALRKVHYVFYAASGCPFV